MTRLPIPGKDSGTWGDILNDYLSQSHKTDGTLKDNSVGSAQLQDNSVGASQLQDNSVTASAIADGAITSSQLHTDITSSLAGKQDKSTLEADVAGKVGSGGALDEALSSTYATLDTDTDAVPVVKTTEGQIRVLTPEAARQDAGRMVLPRGGRYVFLGDSVTIGSDSATSVFRGDAWPVYASLLSQQRITYLRNSGVIGNTTAQMLARFDTDVTPYSPTAVTIAGGMNDAPAVSLATFSANIVALVAKVRAIGATPVLLTVTPCIVESKAARIGVYNTWLRRYAAAERIALVDLWDLLVDTATGGLAAAYDSGDGKHPNEAARALMGAEVAARLADANSPSPAPLSTSNVDPTNLLLNSLFLTDTNADGVPDNWGTYSNPAGSSYSLVPSDGMLGKALRITCTATPSATWVRAVVSTGFAVGDRIQVSGLVKSSGVAPNIQLQFGSSVGNVNIWPLKITKPCTLGAVSVEYVIPAGTANLQLFLQTAAGGTGWAEFGQMSIRNLTALGIS